MCSTMSSTRKRIVAGAAIALMSLPLAACGSSTDSTTTKAPKPVAAIDSLSGQSTAIKLDKGFTDALTQLKLTPGVVGTAKLTAGSLVFPITGGNVTVFKPG